MSGRADIEPSQSGFRRLSYTCRCGWVDWGHALPGNALGLKRQLDSEVGSWPGLDRVDIHLCGRPAFVIYYGQAMGRGPFSVSTARHWVVRKGLDAATREGVALGIFMSATQTFEQMQSSFPYSLVTDSGFSMEDVTSNLIGFYSAFRNVPQTRMRTLCAEVSVEESYKVWDEHMENGLGAVKNRSARPILFPCAACENRDTSFPAELAAMRALPAGELYVAPRQRFIDGALVNSGRPMSIDAAGGVSLRR